MMTSSKLRRSYLRKYSYRPGLLGLVLGMRSLGCTRMSDREVYTEAEAEVGVEAVWRFGEVLV